MFHIDNLHANGIPYEEMSTFNNEIKRPQNVTILKTVAPISAGKVRCLMQDLLSAQVGTPATAHIDREIIPLLAELATLGPGYLEHPTAIQLFNWLVEPHRSAEEFTYVIGPLEQHVYDVMMNLFKPYVYKSFRRGCKFVGKIAAEALAVRSSILDGSWETAGWFVAHLNKRYKDHFRVENYGYASDQLTTWIISAIGDPDICPSSYLRIELIHLLIMMVEINEHNKMQALDSVMSAFASLNPDYLEGGHDTGFFNMDFNTIFDTLEMFASQKFNQYLYEYDEKVAEELKKVLDFRLLIMLKDFACNHSINPSMCSEPRELNSLIALLTIANDRVKLEWNRFQDEGIYEAQWAYLEPLSRAVNVLIMSFRSSFETPQLMEAAALCVMDLLELVLLANVALWEERRDLYHSSLSNTNNLLNQLLDFDDPDLNTTVGREIICYDDRLKILKEKWQSVRFINFPNFYPMISCLLNGGYVWQADF